MITTLPEVKVVNDWAALDIGGTVGEIGFVITTLPDVKVVND